MHKKSVYKILTILAITLAFLVLSYKSVNACSVHGEIFNATGSLKVGNATVYCVGGAYGTCYDDDPTDTGYFCDFGGPMVNCNTACPTRVNATAVNSTLIIWGYNSTSSPDADNDMTLNIYMHEWNLPTANFGTRLENGITINSQSQTFEGNCSDDTGVSALQIWGDWGGGWSRKGMQANPGNGTWANVTIDLSAGSGTYKWAVMCNDTYNNIGWTTTNRTFTLDLSAITITIRSPDTAGGYYNSTDMWFNVTTSKTASWCGYSLNGESNISMTNSSGTWNSRNASMLELAHTVVFSCNDSLGSWATASRLFTMDRTKPIIILVSPDNAYTFSVGTTTIPFSWNVTDNLDTSIDCVVYTSLSNFAKAGCSNATTCSVNGTGFSAGSYTWYVTCNDGVNYNSSETRSFTIQAGTSNPPGGGGGGGGGNACLSVGGNCSVGSCPVGYYQANLTGCTGGKICCVLIKGCGDGVCNKTGGENCFNCPGDCGCTGGLKCLNDNGNYACISCNCGDGTCNPLCGENETSCPKDCAKCGNGKCEAGETSANCCTDCGCPAGQKCIENSCVKPRSLWWLLWLLLALAIAALVYLIVRALLNRHSLIRVIINIGKEIDKKKFHEIQRKTKGPKLTFEKENKRIEKNIAIGLKICKDKLAKTIEKEEIKAIEKLVESKKEKIHEINLLFDKYKKVVRKERLAFEEDLKDILYLEEIPNFTKLKKEVFNLYNIEKEVDRAKKPLKEFS